MNEVHVALQLDGIVKRLEKTEEGVDELQQAMVGSVDGTRKGFAQQLIAAMEKMAEIHSRIASVENKVVRWEGMWAGGRGVTLFFWTILGVLIGTSLTAIGLFFRFHK